MQLGLGRIAVNAGGVSASSTPRPTQLSIDFICVVVVDGWGTV